MLSTLAVVLLGLLPQAHSLFTITCPRPMVIERADPILSYYAPSGHVHATMGASNFGTASSYELLRESRCTSCDTPDDLSAYWTPQMYFQWANGSFTPVEQKESTIMYFRRLNVYDLTGVTAFPPGFQMVSGDPNLRSYNSSNNETLSINWHCYDTNADLVPKPADSDDSPDIPARNCGTALVAQIRFPTCWDGIYLSSKDQSHMAYTIGSNGLGSDQGQDITPCPLTHPVRLVELYYSVKWDVDAWNDERKNAKDPSQPFVLANGDPTGYGLHADFQNGWEFAVLQSAIDVCLKQNAPIGPAACDQLRRTVQNSTNVCQKTSDIHESVLETLDELPGCNPVTYDSSEIPRNCSKTLPQILSFTVSEGDPVQPFQYPASAYPGGASLNNSLPSNTSSSAPINSTISNSSAPTTTAGPAVFTETISGQPETFTLKVVTQTEVVTYTYLEHERLLPTAAVVLAAVASSGFVQATAAPSANNTTAVPSIANARPSHGAHPGLAKHFERRKLHHGGS